MPTEPLLNFEELLQPIPGDDPHGGSVPYTLKQELEDLRKEENPEDYDPGDPQRPAEAKKADWPRILRLTREALTNSSKDLLLSARLTEALTKIHNFAGLRDGLLLMYQLVDVCWDFLNPPITEPDDLEIRAAAFNWLDDPDRGARFPYTIQTVPLVFGEEGYSWVSWRQASEGKGTTTKDTIETAINNTSTEQCRDILHDIQSCRETLSKLVEKLTERVGIQVAPSFTFLRPALENCYTFMEQIVKRKGPLPGEETADGEAGEGEAGAGGEGGGEGGGQRKRTNSREDLYRQLNDIATQLRNVEPHSPIPYLILKAVELGAMPFPALMRALIRNDEIIGEMNRELGIKDEAPQ